MLFCWLDLYLKWFIEQKVNKSSRYLLTAMHFYKEIIAFIISEGKQKKFKIESVFGGEKVRIILCALQRK